MENGIRAISRKTFGSKSAQKRRRSLPVLGRLWENVEEEVCAHETSITGRRKLREKLISDPSSLDTLRNHLNTQFSKVTSHYSERLSNSATSVKALLRRKLSQPVRAWKTKPEEYRRLHEDKNDPDKKWREWGPYLSERQWGTVREDYSSDGSW